MNFRILSLIVLTLIVATHALGLREDPNRHSIQISNGLFVVRGTPTFLLGMSYFDALSAPQENLEADIGFLRVRGFNAIRVWASWYETYQPRAISIIRLDGTVNPEGMSRLRRVLDAAKSRAFLVSLVFSRDTLPGISVNNYKLGIRRVTAILKPYRFVFFDVQNETNHCGAAGDPDCKYHLTLEQVAELRQSVKQIDPGRLVTASRNGEPITVGKDDYLTLQRTGNLDFIATHRPTRTKDGTWAYTTDNEVQLIRSVLGPSIPILFDEPNRCDRHVLCDVSSASNLFITAAKNAKKAGAAGWFFHTKAAFRLSSRTLSFQLNSVEESAVDRIAQAIGR